jgi:hypothetical protein
MKTIVSVPKHVVVQADRKAHKKSVDEKCPDYCGACRTRPSGGSISAP